MKKIVFILIFLSLNAFTQENILKANPVGYAFKIYNLGYEFKVAEKKSAQITIYGYDFSNYNGYAINGEYRMYFKEALKGWFWGPNFIFLKAKGKNPPRYPGDIAENENIYALNAEIGHQCGFFPRK